ncbi:MULTISPECIES: SMP-30/gluconolactonase/LRE family protein [unclassified Achromobacter]|uniref:SMP-30/gluconolactonase/LRE family protein n=1 Tax=unclassified Achromobacter TaxID=2626865 RepID=UPI0018E9D7C8|nr:MULTISPECIES: SMP-30/gluconolactonase/LRE family protein [unclassified Achromobacter]
MWNLSFKPPEIIDATILTRLPEQFRQAQRTEWSDANKPGHALDSFLEGPSFDRDGNLWVTDIPNGRIFRIDTALNWTLAAHYDGWPNGSAFHRDGSLWIADYRRGILRLEPGADKPQAVMPHRNSESFKGINDLTFDAQGACLFTDQGQTGMQDPTGHVYRLGADGRLEPLIRNAPSPNGLALNADGSVLYVAVTRANAIWRAPLPASGGVNKVGQFQAFFGASGPDGLAVDVNNGVAVGHASLRGAFLLNAHGEITHYVRSPIGATLTNLAYRPGTNELIMVESQTGTLLTARLPHEGLPLYSHA